MPVLDYKKKVMLRFSYSGSVGDNRGCANAVLVLIQTRSVL